MSEGRPSSGEQANAEPQRLFLAQLLGPAASGADNCPERPPCTESLESKTTLPPPVAECEKQFAEGISRPRWWEITEASESEEDDAPCQAQRCLELQVESKRLHALQKRNRADYATLQADIERMQALLKEHENQNAKLLAEAEHLQTMLASSRRQQEELQAKNISLTEALQGAQDEKTLAYSEAAELRLQLSERAGQLTHFQENITTLSTALEAARLGEAKATDELLVLRSEHESMQLQLQQQKRQQQQKRERQPKQSQRCIDESVGEGNCSPAALTSLTAKLHKAQTALVSIVPELERRLEEKDTALVCVEKRMQSLLWQLDCHDWDDYMERQNTAGLQEKRKGAYLKTEQRMHTMQAAGPGKTIRASLAPGKKEARLATERDSVGRSVPPAG